jgi:hypothetical protein
MTNYVPDLVVPREWGDIDVIRREAGRILHSVREEELRRGQPLTAAQWFARGLEVAGQAVPENAQQVVRAGLSSASVTTAFSTQVNLAFFDAFRSAPNSLAEIVTIQSVENFLPATAISQWQSGRLTVGGRGGADSFFFGLAGQPWGLARYSTVFSIDEVDIFNSPQIDLATIATKEVARAAKRCVSDLLWALLLSNPTMADGNAVFSGAHANYASGASSSLLWNQFSVAGTGAPDTITYTPSALEAGVQAIGQQTLTDGEGLPIHVNLTPTILITAPGCYGAGRQQARRMKLAENDPANLSVLMESRLGSKGVVNPPDGNVYSSADGSWLLAVPGKVSPSIILGGLNGDVDPTLRLIPLGGPGAPGRWGISCDCRLDIEATIVDFRPLYFSAGQ